MRGIRSDSARLLHVVNVTSVEILFVKPEENVEVRRHRAHFRVKVPFNPLLFKLVLSVRRFREQHVMVVVVYDLKCLLDKAPREPPAKL